MHCRINFYIIKENGSGKSKRYYQGVIDLELIEKGESYSKLAKSFVIFICTFDYFKRGKHIYLFENVCLDDNALPLQDGTQKIILNTRGTADDVDEEMLEFLRYIEASTDKFAMESKGGLVKKIHETVRRIKVDQKLEVEYMAWEQKCIDVLEEGRESVSGSSRADWFISGFRDVEKRLNQSSKERQRREAI